MLNAGMPAADAIDFGATLHTTTSTTESTSDQGDRRANRRQHAACPGFCLRPKSFNGTAVLWFDGQGKSHLFGPDGKPTPAVRKLLDAGDAVVSVDLFLTGEFVEPAAPGPAEGRFQVRRASPSPTTDRCSPTACTTW